MTSIDIKAIDALGKWRFDVVVSLIKDGFDPCHLRYAGMSLFHVSVRYNLRELVESMLCLGANPNHCTSSGLSPLALSRNIQTLMVLLDGGADPNFSSLGANRPIIEQASRSISATSLLLRAGADASVCDKQGNTVLHLALRAPVSGIHSIHKADLERLVKQLIEVINPNSPNLEGVTAYDLAKFQGYGWLIPIFEEAQDRHFGRQLNEELSQVIDSSSQRKKRRI